MSTPHFLAHRCLSFVFPLVALAALPACSSDDGSSDTPDTATDGSASDGAGGSTDASASDAGDHDAGPTDAGDDDAGPTDAATTDAGSADAATGDAGTTDAGTTDAGTTDAGPAPKRPFVAHKLAIAGVWESAFGGNETLSDTAWATPYGVASVAKFDNDKRWVITQNSKDDKFNPNTFSKVVWTAPKTETKDGFALSSIYVCTVDFGLATADLAEATTKTADDSDPAKSGCGSFGWTQLSAVEVAGTWKTNFGSEEQINRQAWGFAWLRAFTNGKNVAYTQNPEDAKYGPSTFNKLTWTTTKDGKWFYCTVDFGLKSLADAQKSTKEADATDPAKSGCGGFSWTEMSAK